MAQALGLSINTIKGYLVLLMRKIRCQQSWRITTRFLLTADKTFRDGHSLLTW